VPRTQIKPIYFPVWVPQDARAAFITFYDLTYSDRDCRYMLQRLATRTSMQEAWTLRIRFQPDDLVTLTFMTWLSSRRLRQLGSKSRLRKARKILSTPPPYSQTTQQALAIAGAVEAVHPQIQAANKITGVTWQELGRIANFFKRQDDEVNFWVGLATLPRKLGARNADQVSFVNRMCDLLWSRSGSRRRPYALIAILTNVAFDLPEKAEWNADRVKHCYRSRSHGK
jgi:hypothetical protein